MDWEKRIAANPRRGWNPAHQRLALLTLAYAGCMAYSLFLAGAAQRIPTIWTANAVLIAGLLLLNRRQGLALLGLTAVVHVVMELSVGDSPRFVLTITVLDACRRRRRPPCCG
jgi:integral membrane sensor domain MASE1